MEPSQQQIVGTFSVIALLRTVLRTPSLFGAFCLGCLLTPLLVTVVPPQQSNTSVAPLGALPELAPRPFDAQAWLGHFADPAVALGGALMLLVEGLRAAAGILSPGDERAANWFLLNGGVIHTMMDGLTGGYHFLPLMDENYRRLDNRANGVLVDGLAKTGGTPGLTDDAVAVAMVVFRMELYVMAPLCFATYWAIHARKGFAPALEIITLTIQLCGTVWFVGPELLTGCLNMVPIGVPGCVAGTAPYELLYFWFAVGANVVWIVVPMGMIWRAAAKINRADQLLALVRAKKGK